MGLDSVGLVSLQERKFGYRDAQRKEEIKGHMEKTATSSPTGGETWNRPFLTALRRNDPVDTP